MVKIAHSLVLIDANCTQHDKLVKAISERKYHFASAREGYNRVHVSEVRLYNFRCKKEVLPHFLKDLQVSNLNPDIKITLKDVIKGPAQSGKNAFFDGRFKLIIMWLIKKLSKFVRIEPVTLSDKNAQPFVTGWTYSHALGQIKDIDRGQGEEL